MRWSQPSSSIHTQLPTYRIDTVPSYNRTKNTPKGNKAGANHVQETSGPPGWQRHRSTGAEAR